MLSVNLLLRSVKTIPDKRAAINFARSFSSDVEIEDDLATVAICELAPINYYEAQIMSSMTGWHGQRITSYRIPKTADLSKLRTSRSNFNDQHKDFNKIKPKEILVGAEVECDLYFKSSSPICLGTMAEFLDGVVVTLHDKSGVGERSSIGEGFIFMEMAMGYQHLLAKLWQLERAVQVLPLVGSQYKPVGLVVLVNGDEKATKRAIDLVQIPPDAEIKKYPLFIGWTPTRNIFTMLKTLSNDIGIIKTLLGQLVEKKSN